MQQRSTPWGASGEEWTHFAKRLDLTADLLPVVSNPKAVISGKSKMAAVGKTPSTYNRDHEVVGIPQWTSHRATERDVARWSRESDLGICVQTRVARAIDIDIGDAEVAQRVRDAVELHLDLALPTRVRPDTGKCLLMLRMPGEFGKRVIRTAHGAIEFLATGQQFIAVGTHPSGAAYRWEGGLPAEVPEVTPAAFEALWASLQALFGIEPSVTGRGLSQRPLVARNADDIQDPVVSFLDATGWVRGWQRDGRVDVRCPWEGEHTTETGESATTWFPAGVGGFDQGHFRCLHAHCEHRSDQEFLEEVGYIADAFDVVVTGQGGVDPETGEILPEEAKPLPVFQRKRNGAILSNVSNLSLAMRRPDVCGVHISYDQFLDAIVLAQPVANLHEAQWRSFTDADYTELRVRLERGGFEPVGREVIRDVVGLVARDQSMDSAIEWLSHRVPAWDGVSRIETFWHRYFNAEDTPYTRAVGVYAWTALAGRVLQPGVKADMVPVLISPEGTAKTSGVAAIAPSPDYFSELALNVKDDDLARKMRGVLVGELGELRGLNTRDRESILSWVTRTHEEWTPKFKEFKTKFPRRLVLFGTTNEVQFLEDTGAEDRRWLPMLVGFTDMAALAADRDQLWAEGRERFKAAGVAWQAARELAREVRGDHRISDSWSEVVWAWLSRDGMDEPGNGARGLQPVRAIDVLVGALGIPTGKISQADERRLGKVLRSLGYERKTARFEGRPTMTWQPSNSLRDQLRGLHVGTSVEDLA